MNNIIKYGKFKGLGRNKLKRQIIICHTAREVDEYLTSLEFRYNGNYDKIPNYLINRSGEVIELLSPQYYTRLFSDQSINKNSVIISLENLGWLDKKPLSNEYINWKGSIYKEVPYEKKWRDYFFWHPYTDAQLDGLVELCDVVCEEHSIDKKSVGHNTKIEGIKNYEGIVSRSNYDSRYTDLNPSFNFEKFEKKLENEQISR